MPTEPDSPRHVVIVGGGIAALEAVLALRDLAGGRVQVTLVAPNAYFALGPLSVVVPFGRSAPTTIPLAEVLADHGGAFVQDAVLSVDAARQVVVCASGVELAYDELLLAPGARAVPAFDRVLTFEPAQADALSGVVADLEEGWSRSVAFVVPTGITWALPLYELALMTAEQVAGMGMDGVPLHVVTPESRPLAVFGAEASDAVRALLDAAGITFHGSAVPAVPTAGHVDLGVEREVVVDRIVALPRLEGPGIDGVPADADGFIATDADGRVVGQDHVWAIGDATQQPIKQGGLACQQADAVAARLAAEAGADVEVGPVSLVLRGRLLAGHEDRFLKRPIGTATSQAARTPLWWPPAKVSSRYLTPYLQERGLVAREPHERHADRGVDVHVPIDWTRAHRPEVLGLDSLG